MLIKYEYCAQRLIYSINNNEHCKLNYDNNIYMTHFLKQQQQLLQQQPTLFNNNKTDRASSEQGIEKNAQLQN